MTVTSSTIPGHALCAVARQSLQESLRGAPVAARRDVPPVLLEPGASFVTLRRKGELRGCVGSLEAVRPLVEDVRQNAVNAAARDPRFPPLLAEELDEVEIEVTVLTRPEPMTVESEEDALDQLRPGRDGVVLSWRGRRSTLLPQVWKSLPEPAEFLACLKRKAGLAPDFWDEHVHLARYRADSWTDGSS